MKDPKEFLLKLADLMDGHGVDELGVDAPDNTEGEFGSYLWIGNVYFNEYVTSITPADIRQKAAEL